MDKGLEHIQSYVIWARPIKREDFLPFLARLVPDTSGDTVQHNFAWGKKLEAEET